MLGWRGDVLVTSVRERGPNGRQRVEGANDQTYVPSLAKMPAPSKAIPKGIFLVVYVSAFRSGDGISRPHWNRPESGFLLNLRRVQLTPTCILSIDAQGILKQA
jgi:hypothetical protein